MYKNELQEKVEFKPIVDIIAKLNKYLWLAPLDVKFAKVELDFKYRILGRVIIIFFICITLTFELSDVQNSANMTASFFFSLMFRVCKT